MICLSEYEISFYDMDTDTFLTTVDNVKCTV